MLIEALSFLFIADDVAIISVPTPNLVLHSNDITYIDKALIIVGTVYYVCDILTIVIVMLKAET